MISALTNSYRRLRFGSPIVVVSGLPRSGTSMAMKMLEAGGVPVFVDGVRTADIDNPKGYYEYERVKDLAEEDDKSWVRAARGKAIKVISFLLKELPEDNNYRVVFMRRNLEEVLASQSKMLDHRGEGSETDDVSMAELYESHLWRTGYLLRRSSHLSSLDVDYKGALSDPRAAAEAISAFLGGSLDVGAMAGVVDKNLYRNRR